MLLLQQLCPVIFAVQLICASAYPTINIQRLFGAGRQKKSDVELLTPQSDEDVVELEQLKHDNDHDKSDITAPPHHHQVPQPHERHEEHKDLLLPELERQLEAAAAAVDTTTTSAPTPTNVQIANEPGQLEHEQVDKTGQHRPPMLPNSDAGKAPAAANPQQSTEGVVSSPMAPSMTKPFYGAARLAFGQNPEVLPTSTSTTISTVPSSTSTATSIVKEKEEQASVTEATPESVTSLASDLTIPLAFDEHKTADNQMKLPSQGEEPAQDAGGIPETKENLAPILLGDELIKIKSTARRSIPVMPPKTAESLLKHRDGQYSSFDMAQYVFWTGDEAGVARAVEEFIEQGLMTRENALKFLRDIRLGIEYLQRSYANRVFPEEISRNNVKKNYHPPTPTPTTTVAPTTTTTTTEKPLLFMQQPRVVPAAVQHGTDLTKSLSSITMWNKLQQLNNEERQDLSDYDEAAGRAKIAEFLYTEYSLEEILYKLAKVMFTQSLAHGSDEAQQELQKLTDFLEREGNLGVIPIDLQKKVLHVLLRALSDTLSEHPELLPAARLNLANPYNRLPLHDYTLGN